MGGSKVRPQPDYKMLGLRIFSEIMGAVKVSSQLQHTLVLYLPLNPECCQVRPQLDHKMLVFNIFSTIMGVVKAEPDLYTIRCSFYISFKITGASRE